MSAIDEMQAEPWRFDFFSVMRRLERSYRELPRIGDSATKREEFVQLGQDPYMEFPASNLQRVENGNQAAEGLRQVPRASWTARRTAVVDDRGEPELDADAG